jgi:thioredoxin reductase (NADPH)
MLTIDEVRAISLFSTLAVTDLERLAQTSADMHLGAGEFAVPEGENVHSSPARSRSSS